MGKSNTSDQRSGQVERSPADLEAIASLILDAANHRRGDALALLALLRHLEALHQEIQDGWFQDCLPTNRQALYALLKDMEAEGGWPYIPRMKLRLLINHFLGDLEEDNGTSRHENSSNR